MTELEAKDILRGMTFEECIKMFNERMTDSFFFLSTIHEIDDDNWWRALFAKRFANVLAFQLLDSYEEGKFKRSEQYFFFNEEEGVFYSFSIKEDLFEIIGEEFFITEIINRK